MASMANLIILLDLFERGNFSILDLLHALQMPWMLLTAGLGIVLIALWTFSKSQQQEG
jgi:hypothetical protein